MATKNVYVNLDMNQQQLINASVQIVGADPGSGFQGQLIYNSTDQRLKWWDSTASLWRSVAHLIDLEAFSAYVGPFDASTNAVPTTGSGPGGNVRAGDRWLISVGTTGAGIPGLTGGNAILEAGDVLIAVNDVASGAAVAGDFIAVQTNIDLSAGVPVAENLALANLPANTPTSIGSSLTTLHSIQVFNSSGMEIEVAIDVTNQQIESNVALTNLVIRTLGLA